MSGELALLIVLAAPIAHALGVLALSRPPGLRDFVHIGFSLAAAVAAAFLLDAVAREDAVRIVLARPLPNVDLAFTVEPLGALMAAVLAGLGALQAVHTVGFLRATQEKASARMMAFIALASASTMAMALSANLFTMFVAYQALILTTFPLVAHRADDEAHAAARSYLATLLAASAGLFLPAMVWTYAIAGALEFQPGGVLAGRVDVVTANVLLALFVLGLAIAAIPPLHRWLPVSSTAPFPALVSIQALAVLPAGCVGIIKVAAFVFGQSVLQEASLVARGLAVFVGVAMCVAALIALSRQDIRERLAYSAMAQALAAAMGALLALPAGLFASILQIVALACAAATLLMASATVYAVTGRRDVGDYAGLGRIMPWTMAAFAIATASMIGMPPFAGAWAKLWLIAAASGAGLMVAAVLAGAAAVLTFAHLAPLAAGAFAGRAPTDAFKRADGASILLVAPVMLAAAATLWLLLRADPLADFLAPVWTLPQ
ncbi:MAG: proton-conducting transporter membrane subunit [Hyphomonadaceae bacterium]